MKAATCYWTCLACDLVGDTDRSGEQHTRTTGHTTMTGTDVETLARMREYGGLRARPIAYRWLQRDGDVLVIDPIEIEVVYPSEASA